MHKVGDKVFIYNREKSISEIGTVCKRYRRQKIVRYDVKLERGILLEYVSELDNAAFYLDQEKNQKFSKILNQ